jgi:hypothetical protein
MNWQGSGKVAVAYFRYYTGIFLDILRKTTKNFSQNSRSPDRDLNSRPPAYEAAVLTARSRRSVYNKSS